jgi:preprotein translocase SecE subunit
MDSSQNQKWVTGSLLAFSILIAYIVFAALFKLAGVYDFETKVKNLELVVRLVSLGVGALLFTVLYRNDGTNQFMHEAVTELSRVTWPTVRETYGATFVVIVMVLISGVLLGLMDKFWTLVVQWVL